MLVGEAPWACAPGGKLNDEIDEITRQASDCHDGHLHGKSLQPEAQQQRFLFCFRSHEVATNGSLSHPLAASNALHFMHTQLLMDGMKLPILSITLRAPLNPKRILYFLFRTLLATMPNALLRNKLSSSATSLQKGPGIGRHNTLCANGGKAMIMSPFIR